MAALTMNQFYPQSGNGSRGAEIQPASHSLGLFYRSLVAGWLGQARAALLGRSNRLVDLQSVWEAGRLRSSHSVGARSVPVDRIRGSQGRSEDFDASFHPLQERTRDRWLSVASALQSGLPLPPVELLQVGDLYFVRDGHHRISVARALGQTDVDAEVTVLELSGRS